MSGFRPKTFGNIVSICLVLKLFIAQKLHFQIFNNHLLVTDSAILMLLDLTFYVLGLLHKSKMHVFSVNRFSYNVSTHFISVSDLILAHADALF